MDKSKKGAKTKQITQLSQEESKINKILNFHKLKNTNSLVSCHGRPSGKDLKKMKLSYGVNSVLTLQSSKEKPEDIKKICEENNLKWFFVEMQGANLLYFQKSETQKIILNSLIILYEILRKYNLTLFIHCAAGLHRTGTIIYSLLRMFGESPSSALDALAYIRLETRNKVGDNRIEFAETYIVPSLIKYAAEKDIIENIEKIENLKI